MPALLAAAWRYRSFIVSSIRTDLRARFARSSLGAVWAILHPLAQALIFSLVLSEVLGARLSSVNSKVGYAVYVMAGMAAWGLFSEITNRCMSIFMENSGSLKRIAFPRICLPLVVWGGALINHLLLLAVMACVFSIFGHVPATAWVYLPVGIVLITMFAFGIGVILGIVNVFSRDVGHVYSVLLQIWFWMTPIIYTRDTPPQEWRWIIDLNPMAPLVTIYQDAILYGRAPDPSTLIIPATLGLALFLLSFVMFRRASPELVDAL